MYLCFELMKYNMHALRCLEHGAVEPLVAEMSITTTDNVSLASVGPVEYI